MFLSLSSWDWKKERNNLRCILNLTCVMTLRMIGVIQIEFEWSHQIATAITVSHSYQCDAIIDYTLFTHFYTLLQMFFTFVVFPNFNSNIYSITSLNNQKIASTQLLKMFQPKTSCIAQNLGSKTEFHLAKFKTLYSHTKIRRMHSVSLHQSGILFSLARTFPTWQSQKGIKSTFG